MDAFLVLAGFVAGWLCCWTFLKVGVRELRRNGAIPNEPDLLATQEPPPPPSTDPLPVELRTGFKMSKR